MQGSINPIRIKIILGSTRQGRFSEKPGKWILEEANALDNVAAELLDLRDYPMPFFDSATSPAGAKGNYAHEAVRRWAEKINEGDAFVIIAQEYNHGYTAVLKNALDMIYPEWNRKPVGFVAYGGVMGARAVEQLRQVVVGLGMAPIQSTIHIP
ncbi:NADPH-dependent oxidoreductase, partial [Candidatus Pacearchaeota archaeon]